MTPARPTPAQRKVLLDAALATPSLYVKRDPGEKIPAPVQVALRNGWVTLGGYEPLRGRPVLITEIGRAVSAQAEKGNRR